MRDGELLRAHQLSAGRPWRCRRVARVPRRPAEATRGSRQETRGRDRPDERHEGRSVQSASSLVSYSVVRLQWMHIVSKQIYTVLHGG